MPDDVQEVLDGALQEGAEIQQDSQPTDQASADNAASPQAQDDEPRKQSRGVQKRIDELTREREEWRRASIQSAQTIQQLLTRQQAPAPPVQAPVAEKQPPRMDQYQTLEQFTAAQAEFAAERKAEQLVQAKIADYERRQQAAFENQRAQAEQAMAQQQTANIVSKAWNNVLAARDETPDFDQIITSPEDVPASPMIAYAIATSPNGGKLGVHLAKNPALAQAIMQKSPLDQAMELGKLEVMLGATGKTVSTAPRPGKPAGSRSAPSSAWREDVEGKDPRAFDAWLKAQTGG